MGALILEKYWKVLVGLVLLMGLFAWGEVMQRERDNARAEVEKIRLASQQVKQEAEQRNAAIAAENKRTNEELANDYAKTVAAIHLRGDGGITCRLRNPPRNRDSVPTSPATSRIVDAATSDRVATLPTDCAVTTAVAMGLQKYVREVCLRPVPQVP